MKLEEKKLIDRWAWYNCPLIYKTLLATTDPQSLHMRNGSVRCYEYLPRLINILQDEFSKVKYRSIKIKNTTIKNKFLEAYGIKSKKNKQLYRYSTRASIENSLMWVKIAQLETSQSQTEMYWIIVSTVDVVPWTGLWETFIPCWREQVVLEAFVK